MTVREFIKLLQENANLDNEINFEVKDKYLKETNMELDTDSIFNYPGNTWISLELNEDYFLEA